MIKTFDITLEEQKPVDPQNSFAIYRGDNVQFNFTFLKNGIELEIPSGTILRVFAKKIEKNGIVDVNKSPVFAGEWTDSTSATFNSSLTAGNAGMYLMSVMLVSSNDSVITSQSIYFEIKENGYAGYYQPSADYRDEVLNAKQDSIKARNEAEDFVQQASEYAYTAETSASEASTSESNAFNFAESSRMYSESAITAGSNALQYSQQAEDFKEQAKDFRDETLVARDEAVLAKDTAVEISDPEGWRTNTRSMINALQQTKSNRGEFWFKGGFATISNMSMNGSWSLCCRVKMQIAQVRYASIFHFGAFYLYWNTRLGIYCSPAISSVKQISVDDNNRLANGEWHTLVVSYDGTTLKLTDETGVLLSVATSEVISISGNLLIGESNYNGQIADVKYFNFDMSANDAPYTIADYVAGKDESPLLQGSQPVFDWSYYGNATKTDNTLDYSDEYVGTFIYPRPIGDSLLEAGKTYKFVFRSSSTSAMPRLYSRVGDATKTEVSWQYTNLTTGEVGSGSSIGINATAIFGTTATTDTIESVLTIKPAISHSLYLTMNGGTTLEAISIQQVGALLSLEDYTFNGKIADVSGNNNDATITGDVVGTKDKSIEKMYQAFASKIGNLTE